MEHNGFEYIDLGLPSGNLWAACDVGANSPTDVGLYFQWGDVIGYSINDALNNVRGYSDYDSSWKGYRFGSIYSMTKYNTVDKKTVLDLEDDAAHVNMGGDWRMPTKEDFEELASGVRISPFVLNGVHGILLKSKVNDAELFFVKSGYIDRTKRYAYGSDVYRSSSSLHKKGIAHYFNMYDLSNNYNCINHFFNHYMFPIRGIIKG